MRRGGARIARVAVTTWPTWAPGGLASCSRGSRLHRAWRLPVAARRLSLRIPEVEALHVKLQTPVRRGADARHEKLIGADRFLADVAVFAVRGCRPRTAGCDRVAARRSPASGGPLSECLRSPWRVSGVGATRKGQIHPSLDARSVNPLGGGAGPLSVHPRLRAA